MTYVVANLQHALHALRGQSGSDLGSARAALADALEGAERVSVIVRDLWTFSRTDEAVASIDLSRVVDGALQLVANELRYRAHLERDYASHLPHVLGNEGRLGQVFLNLLVNAGQAMEPSTLDANRIDIRLFTENGWVVAEVEDTGSGIAEEHLPNLFDPFFTTKPVGVGTGLGLAICHQIVDGLGGRIEVDSEVGRGTTFRILLHPSAMVEAPEPDPVKLSDRRGRVLVVDDEPGIRRAMTRVLAELHDVVSVGSGAEALVLFEAEEPIDVVLCDLMMRNVSGMELYDVMVQRWPALAARTLFLSGGGVTERARSFLARMEKEDRVLSKPVAPLELLLRVSRLLEEQP